MSEKLVIIMANTDPRNGEELGAPIFQASVAAAMEYEVDVICTATSGRLMKKGVAENLVVKEGSPKSVYDFIKDAHEAGVKFYCCSPNLDLFDMTEDRPDPRMRGHRRRRPSDRGGHGRGLQGPELLAPRSDDRAMQHAATRVQEFIGDPGLRSPGGRPGHAGGDLRRHPVGPALRPRAERLSQLRHLHGHLPRPPTTTTSARARSSSCCGPRTWRASTTPCRRRSGPAPSATPARRAARSATRRAVWSC